MKPLVDPEPPAFGHMGPRLMDHNSATLVRSPFRPLAHGAFRPPALVIVSSTTETAARSKSPRRVAPERDAGYEYKKEENFFMNAVKTFRPINLIALTATVLALLALALLPGAHASAASITPGSALSLSPAK